MTERGRRSKDASSRYSIDTLLLPGLSTNSRVKEEVVEPKDSKKKQKDWPEEPEEVSVEEEEEVEEEDEKEEEEEEEEDDEVRVLEETTTVSSGGQGSGRKRAASSPLKQATQPKQVMLSAVSSGTKNSRKRSMLEAFQPWVLLTYGDSAKTKTITKKKYYRIVKTLRGEEINNAENSKFRFWVKAKGFHIGLPPGQTLQKPEESSSWSPSEPDLFVPTTVKDGSGVEKPLYKRVAVVEYFFDIIYTVHVETEAKNGKHAGQKRTYRAITEKYAFLPREAVTKFLLQCMECQKRGSPASDSQSLTGKARGEAGGDEGDGTEAVTSRGRGRAAATKGKLLRSSSKKSQQQTSNEELETDPKFCVPFTTFYLRQQRSQELGKKRRKGTEEEEEEKNSSDSNGESHLSDVSPMEEDGDHHTGGKSRNGGVKVEGEVGVEWLGYHPISMKKEPSGPTTCSHNNNVYSNGKPDLREQSSPLSHGDRSAGGSGGGETGQDETSSNGNKDDEDDDDDESEDKIDTQQYDPERLKAFNMFVRLFVDENLDRMVPISKQPKEKIQAIIDSCTRQFPEFAERARKRIRTYLKSCRRNKRSRDTNGWESSRPTPAHLTSVQAEQILAQACENESQNAKRMRMGLEPVGQPLPLPQSQPQNEKSDVLENGHHQRSSSTRERSSREDSEKVSTAREEARALKASAAVSAAAAAAVVSPAITSDLPTSHSTLSSAGSQQNPGHPEGGGRSPSSSSSENQHPSQGVPSAPKAHDRSPLVDYSRALNGNGVPNMSMYRPNFGQAFQRPAPFPALFPPATSISAGVAATAFPVFPHNASPLPITSGDAGPTDLSMKAKPLLTHKLNATEIATVRQLITGYRESAAFLLRSADELEQLLIQQQ